MSGRCGAVPGTARGKRHCRLRYAAYVFATCGGISSRVAGAGVGPSTAAELVIARTALKPVPTRAACEVIPAALAQQPVVAGTTADGVVTRPGADQVIASPTVDNIIAAQACNDVAGRRAFSVSPAAVPTMVAATPLQRRGLTAVPSVSELLALFGSISVRLTEAVLLKVPADVGVTAIVTVAFAPLFKLPRLQVTVAVPLQVPWLGIAETKVAPAGSVSVTTTPVAVSGPLLVTVTV